MSGLQYRVGTKRASSLPPFTPSSVDTAFLNMDSAAASALIVANVLLRIATNTVNSSVLDKQANEICKRSCDKHWTVPLTKASYH
jgi:hypothetical protein